MSARKSAAIAGVKERTGQEWAKNIREIPEWDIYEKKTNLINRKTSQLSQEHKDNIKNFYDENPCATIQDASRNLTESFEGFNLKSTVVGKFISEECNFSIKRPTRHPAARNDEKRKRERFEWVQKITETDMNYLENCVFVDEAGFDINMIPRTARSERGKPAIVTTPSTKAISHSRCH